MGRKSGKSTKVGGVHLDVTADTKGLDQSLDAAEQRVDQFADKVATDTKKAAGSFGAMSERVSSSLSKMAAPMLGLIGTVTALIGAFKLAFTIGTRFGKMLANTAEQAEITSAALKEMAKNQAIANEIFQASLPEAFSKRAALELDAQITKAEEALEKAEKAEARSAKDLRTGILQGDTGTELLRKRREQRAEEAENRLVALLKLRNDATLRGRAEQKAVAEALAATEKKSLQDKEAAEAKAHRTRQEQLEAETNALALQLLGPVARARREGVLAEEALKNRIRDAETQLAKDQLQRSLDIQRQLSEQRVKDARALVNLQIKLDAEKVAREKRDRADKTAADIAAKQRIAQAEANAQTAAFNRQNQRLEQIMGRTAIAAERMVISVERILRRTNP